MDMFRRLFGQSGDEPEDTATNTDDSGDTNGQPVGAVTKELPDTQVDVNTAEFDDDSTDSDMTEGTATRKLPLETVIASRNAHLQFGQSTDVGMVRTNNQDAMLSLYYASRSIEDRPDFGLFIVADGMGGHHDGEKASAIVTQAIAHEVMTNIFMPMLAMDEENNDSPPLTELLVKAIQQANTSVLSDVPDGGTTVTATAVVGNLAYFAHVGDSRAYLIAKNKIEQVTRDHSLVQRLIELEQLTPEEALDHPQQNVLYRAIGQNDSLEVDALTRRLPANSYLLLCSDGLWGILDNDTILRTVQENPNPQKACDKLVALANTKGGRDNITAVMLHIPN